MFNELMWHNTHVYLVSFKMSKIIQCNIIHPHLSMISKQNITIHLKIYIYLPIYFPIVRSPRPCAIIVSSVYVVYDSVQYIKRH